MPDPASTASWHPAGTTQQGLWFIDRIEALRASYLVPSVIEFTGPIDHAALVAALSHVLGRHPALRARFRLEPSLGRVEYRTDGEAARAGLIDVAAGEWSEQEQERLVQALCYTPFDLAGEAPARAEVIRVDAETTLLVLTVHHIVFDGWSRELLMTEIAECYRAAVAGRAPDLAEPVHPASLDEAVPAGEAADRLAEVIERLRGAPTHIDLPYDRDPAVAAPSTEGSTLRTRLDEALTGAVVSAAAREGCTLFMAVAALLAGTLARAGEQRDFLIAFPWAGREDPAAGHAIGMFVNTLVLRIALDEGMSWRSLLRRARAAVLESLAGADVPFGAVAAALHPGRGVTRPPLAPVVISVLDRPPAAPGLGTEIQGRHRPLDPVHVKFDLAFFAGLEPDPVRLALTVDYPTSLFDADTITDFLGAVRRSAVDLAYSSEDAVLEPYSPESADLDDPVTRLEIVRAAWRKALGAAEVGDDVGFFEAGGDSLRLVLLLELLNRASGLTLEVADLFLAGTVRGQAALLTARKDAPAERRAVGRDRLLQAARLRGGVPEEPRA